MSSCNNISYLSQYMYAYAHFLKFEEEHVIFMILNLTLNCCIIYLTFSNKSIRCLKGFVFLIPTSHPTPPPRPPNSLVKFKGRKCIKQFFKLIIAWSHSVIQIYLSDQFPTYFWQILEKVYLWSNVKPILVSDIIGFYFLVLLTYFFQ